jgi:hypothetical protein
MREHIRSKNEENGGFAKNAAGLAAGLLPLALLTLWSAPSFADSAPSYPAMAPVAQYMMDRDAEIVLARSGAPASVADHVEVLVLGAHGYETAVKGSNGFVCYVGRSWENDFSHPEFWEPDNRAPECVNAVTAAWYLPIYRQRTEWVLSGVSKDEMIAKTKAAIAAKQITAPPNGAMCFMLSKQGMLGHQAGGPWHPHVMFYGPPGPDTDWGADLPGSPIAAAPSDLMPYTIYFIPVRRWSDGTLAEYASQPQDEHHSH